MSAGPSEETLLDKAVANYNIAQAIMQTLSADEIYLTGIAYHLQQSVELAIKHILETEGAEYPHTHDIDQLILFAKDNDVDLHITDYIDEHSEMLSVWEAKTRYVKGFRIELRKIETALTEIRDYLKNLRKIERETPTESYEYHKSPGDKLDLEK